MAIQKQAAKKQAPQKQAPQQLSKPPKPAPLKPATPKLATPSPVTPKPEEKEPEPGFRLPAIPFLRILPPAPQKKAEPEVRAGEEKGAAKKGEEPKKAEAKAEQKKPETKAAGQKAEKKETKEQPKEQVKEQAKELARPDLYYVAVHASLIITAVALPFLKPFLFYYPELHRWSTHLLGSPAVTFYGFFSQCLLVYLFVFSLTYVAAKRTSPSDRLFRALPALAFFVLLSVALWLAEKEASIWLK